MLKRVVIYAGEPLPKNDRGHKMCLTIHLISACNSQCKRKRDHHNIEPGSQKHSTREDSKLLAWCAKHIKAELLFGGDEVNLILIPMRVTTTAGEVGHQTSTPYQPWSQHMAALWHTKILDDQLGNSWLPTQQRKKW
jgi:hypothetical protein